MLTDLGEILNLDKLIIIKATYVTNFKCKILIAKLINKNKDLKTERPFAKSLSPDYLHNRFCKLDFTL